MDLTVLITAAVLFGLVVGPYLLVARKSKSKDSSEDSNYMSDDKNKGNHPKISDASQ